MLHTPSRRARAVPSRLPFQLLLSLPRQRLPTHSSTTWAELPSAPRTLRTRRSRVLLHISPHSRTIKCFAKLDRGNALFVCVLMILRAYGLSEPSNGYDLISLLTYHRRAPSMLRCTTRACCMMRSVLEQTRRINRMSIRCKTVIRLLRLSTPRISLPNHWTTLCPPRPRQVP